MTRAIALILTLAVTATVLVLLPGWRDDGPGEPSAALLAATRSPAVVVDDDPNPGVLGADEAVLPAAGLRLLLEERLGEHVLVLAGASRDAADGRPLGEALAAVEPNTRALGEAIGLVYGEVGEQAFTSLWTQHIAFFLDRAAAAGASDREGITAANRHLHHYEQDFGSFTATATEGRLPAEVVTALLEGHVADVDSIVTAHLAGDGDAFARHVGLGHRRVGEIGAGLATAIAAQGPTAFPGSTSGPGVDGAAAVGQALAAHLAATSLELDASTVHAERRAELVEDLAAVATDPATTRAATTAWLEARDDELPAAARALAATLPVAEPAAVTAALVTYVQGLDAGLLDPATRDAHAAGYQVAGALLVP